MKTIEFKKEDFVNDASLPDKLLSKYNIAIITDDTEAMYDWTGDGSRTSCWYIKMFIRNGPTSAVYFLDEKNEFTNISMNTFKRFDSYAEAVAFLKNSSSLPVKCHKYELVEVN